MGLLPRLQRKRIEEKSDGPLGENMPLRPDCDNGVVEALH